MKDYYQILEVSRSATSREIKSAYRRLAKKYHPDASGYKGADKLFSEINEAYSVLGDAAKKSTYDLKWSQPAPTYTHPRNTTQQRYTQRRPHQRPRYKKKASSIDLTPYVHYFKNISKITFGLCMLFVLDFGIPTQILEDEVTGRSIKFVQSRNGMRYHDGLYIHLEHYGKFRIDKESASLIPNGAKVTIHKTRLLRKIKHVTFESGRQKIEYPVQVSIYHNFSFALIALIITSSLGVFRKNNPEMALNLAIVNGIITLIVLYFAANS